jgi:hypothetical protein
MKSMTHRSFPPDLVALHEAYTRTYQALAHAQPGRSARLRRDLVRLQARLLAHPYWSHRPGSPTAGWALLREQLREDAAPVAGRRAG